MLKLVLFKKKLLENALLFCAQFYKVIDSLHYTNFLRHSKLSKDLFRGSALSLFFKKIFLKIIISALQQQPTLGLKVSLKKNIFLYKKFFNFFFWKYKKYSKNTKYNYNFFNTIFFKSPFFFIFFIFDFFNLNLFRNFVSTNYVTYKNIEKFAQPFFVFYYFLKYLNLNRRTHITFLNTSDLIDLNQFRSKKFYLKPFFNKTSRLQSLNFSNRLNIVSQKVLNIKRKLIAFSSSAMSEKKNNSKQILSFAKSTNYIIFHFLRKNIIYNKSRYSRNKQTYRTGVFFCIWLTILTVIGLYFYFYFFSIKFTFFFIGFFLFVLSFCYKFFFKLDEKHWDWLK